jgi:hypothetical protein
VYSELLKKRGLPQEMATQAVHFLINDGMIRRETRKINGVGVVVLVSELSSVDERSSSSRPCIDPGLLMPFRAPRKPTGSEGAQAEPVPGLSLCPKVAVFFSEMERGFWEAFSKMWDHRTEGKTRQPAGSWNVGEIPARCHLQNVESAMYDEMGGCDAMDLRAWIRRCLVMGLLTKVGHHYAPGHNPLDVIVHALPGDARPVVVLSHGDAQTLSRARACMEELLGSGGVVPSSAAGRLQDELLKVFENDRKIVSKLMLCFTKVGKGSAPFPRLTVPSKGGNLIPVSLTFSTMDVLATETSGKPYIVQPSGRGFASLRDDALVQYESGVRRS